MVGADALPYLRNLWPRHTDCWRLWYQHPPYGPAKLPANLHAKFLTAIKNLRAKLTVLTKLTRLTVFKTDRGYYAL
jgi:hypothetical protein